MKKILVALLIILIAVVFIIPKGKEETPPPDTNPTLDGVLGEFMNLYEIPRGEENTKKITAYLKSWAKENDIDVTADKSGNVIMEKPASEGYENAPVTILQSRMDMVYIIDDNVDLDLDPYNEPIVVINDGETLHAEGINLGADSGAGMATALYLMKNVEQHGPMKAIFTADSESATPGAAKLNDKYLEGDYLINLNSGSDKTLCIGSSGFTLYEMSHALTWQPPANNNAFEISLRDFKGGHAGNDVEEDHANAVKVLGTMLAQAQSEGIVLELASFNGGVADDLIPSDATAVIVLNDYDVKKFRSVYNDAKSVFKSDYGSVEKDAAFTLTEAAIQEKVLSRNDGSSIISYLYGIVDGISSISPSDKTLAESSSNIGNAYTYTGNFTSQVLVRSSSLEKSAELAQAHDALCSMCGIDYMVAASGPPWDADPNSTLAPALQSDYRELFNKKMALKPINTPLECGWFAQKNPNLDMISLGFGIDDAGTSEETLRLDTLTRPAEVVTKFLADTITKPEPPATTDSAVATDGSVISPEAADLQQ